MKNEVKELKKDVINSGKDFYKVILDIGRVIRESYYWVADIRIKAPRLSFGIELMIFFLVTLGLFVNYESILVGERDSSMMRNYKQGKMFEDSLLSVEAAAFSRGMNLVRDSIRNAKPQTVKIKKKIETKKDSIQ